jgi:alkylated DNA repair dioxygenase AlkB
MERVFQNADGTAFLAKGTFPNMVLLEKCIAYIKPLLEHQPEIIVYGKKCKQQRNVGFFSNESIGYNYSRQIMKSQSLGPELAELLRLVNEMLGANFNGILANEYPNGENYIGAHSDSEIGLDAKVGVVSISYGAERKFRIRSKVDTKIVCDEPTTHGQLLVMGGINFQKLYTHEIPIQKKIKESRISFTFRKHLE